MPLTYIYIYICKRQYPTPCIYRSKLISNIPYRLLPPPVPCTSTHPSHNKLNYKPSHNKLIHLSLSHAHSSLFLSQSQPLLAHALHALHVAFYALSPTDFTHAPTRACIPCHIHAHHWQHSKLTLGESNYLFGSTLNRRLRPYHVENTGSRPITEVKQRRARLVLGWVTAWEYRVS